LVIGTTHVVVVVAVLAIGYCERVRNV
jgi:hypothetical protein